MKNTTTNSSKTTKSTPSDEIRTDPKTGNLYKIVRVEPKDIPLHDLIGKVVINYLKEIVAQFPKAFAPKGYTEAASISGTLSLHRSFFNLCTISSELKISFETLSKQMVDDVQELETILHCMSEANFRKVEHMQKIALAMRPGHAWRKELDAVGLRKNSDKWLSCWDENLPKIQTLMKKRSDKKTKEMPTPQSTADTPPPIRFHDPKNQKDVAYPAMPQEGKRDWMILDPHSIMGTFPG